MILLSVDSQVITIIRLANETMWGYWVVVDVVYRSDIYIDCAPEAWTGLNVN
jgi:hypothetical protein